ncbi:MAG TPA: transglutaminaseTgpA domain-containing protein [Demequinaceae bacterium]
MTGTSRSPVAATPLLAVATFAAFWAFGAIVELGPWLERSALALAGVTGVIMLVRLISRSRGLPTLAGAATTFLVLIPLYARGEDGTRFALPTPSAVSALFRTFADGATYAQSAARPAAVTLEYESLLTLGVLVLFVAAEHLAVSWRAVATAGLVLLAPWAPAVATRRSVPGVVVIVALAAWVLALAISRRSSPIGRRVPWTTSLLATAAVLVVVALVVPTAIGGSGWGVIAERYAPDLFDGRNTRLDLDLDLRTSLTANSQTAVFAYVSPAGRADAFRVYTFADFDGASWTYRDPAMSTVAAAGPVLWPTEVTDWATAPRAQLTVAMLSLTASNLPIPVAPRTVDASGNWFYDAATDQIVGSQITTHDLTYSILVDFAYQNAEALRATDAEAALGQAEDLADPTYLAIPSAVALPRVLALTREVTADTTTRYDQALAIQSYLRDPTRFTYDTSSSAAGSDAVSAFLDSGHGYCLQFATTMVMMLRSIGIPARLSEGFLPGTAASDGTFVVRGADAHAWPEVYFAGRGWVRFEPTPAVQTGLPPAWADPDPNRVPGDATSGDVPAVPAGPDDGTESPAIPTPIGDRTGGLPAWVIPLAAGAIAAAALSAFLWRRRGDRAHHGSPLGAEAAWQRLNRRLREAGWPASATPMEATSHVLRAIRAANGRPVRAESVTALLSLSAAVSDRRYAPSCEEVPQAQLSTWVEEVVAEADATTGKETKRRPARGGARNAPQAGS